MIANIINKIIKIPNMIDNCMNFYICGNEDNIKNENNIKNEDNIKNDINIIKRNQLNTTIPKINISNGNISNNIMVSLINICNMRLHKINTTRKPLYNDNLLDELYICNYCKRNCTLDIYRFMDNSYCSKYCRNQVISPFNITKKYQ